MPRRTESTAPTPTWLKSRFGNVRVYTRRHLGACTFISADQQNCSCPKWIYAKPHEGKPRRFAAETPSYTEAVESAQEQLDGMNPKIARIEASHTRVRIEAAITEYFAIMKPRVSKRYFEGFLPSIFLRAVKHASGRQSRLALSLLDFLDTQRPDVKFLHQLKGADIDQWALGWKLADTTAAGRRSAVSSFLQWAEAREMIAREPKFTVKVKVKPGNRCGWLEPDAYAKLIGAISAFEPSKFSNQPLPENFAPRMRALIELGRWAGMAMADLIKFQPATELVGDVVLYARHKNGQIAGPIVLPSMELANRLRTVPLEPGASSAQPFRFHDNEETSAIEWRRRFARLCKFAGLTEITTTSGRRKAPHPHMLRDTYAIDNIIRGVQLDNLAKMMGHTNTDMLQEHYSFWIKQREVYCEQQQRIALAGVKLTPVISERVISSRPN
jgi:site-specific recombinase XerD